MPELSILEVSMQEPVEVSNTLRRPNRSIGFLVAGLLVVGLSSPQAFAQAKPTKIPPIAMINGDRAPHVVGYNLDNTVEEFMWEKFPVHVVQFWASFSQPSIDEFSTLQQLYSTHGDRLGILAVTWEPLSLDNLKALRRDVGLEFPMVRPHHKFDMQWKSVGAFPTTFLIDNQGIILRRYLGWSERHAQALVNDVTAALAGETMGATVSPTPDEYTTANKYLKSRRDQARPPANVPDPK